MPRTSGPIHVNLILTSASRDIVRGFGRNSDHRSGQLPYGSTRAEAGVVDRMLGQNSIVNWITVFQHSKLGVIVQNLSFSAIEGGLYFGAEINRFMFLRELLK